MNAKRLCVIGLVLAGFAFLLFVSRFLRSDEPTYQGKPVSVWFKEYAFASNAVLSTVSGIQGGRTVIGQITFGSRMIALSSSNAPVRIWSVTPDPAWTALQALGSNAVPQLVYRLRIGKMDRTYEQVFTNLPSALQRKLPNPAQKKWFRMRALEAIGKLGDPARAASPALLELLRQNDPWLRRDVVFALRSVHTDRRAISGVLLQLGQQRRYGDVADIAWETGWDGSEMTRLLGRILQSKDPALRRNAMRLLERVGRDAAPALEQVTAALKDSDAEVRYLAARSLEYIGTDSPEVIAALRASLRDENVMVQNVARRVLRKLEPDAVQLQQADAAEKN